MAVIKSHDNTVTEACHVTRRAKMSDKSFDKRVIDDAIKAGTISLGYQELKEDQTHVIKSFVEGNDVFACLPTGYGKSLCYFSLPIIFDLLHQHSRPWSVVIVISPLQALMRDQVISLERKGIKAITVVGHGELDDEDSKKEAIVSGNAQVIFTTPEVLLTDKNWVDVFQSPSLHQRLVGIIIDEAHLVKKWYVLIGVISFIEYTIFYVGAVISEKNFPSWVICVDFFLPNSGSWLLQLQPLLQREKMS